MAYHDPYTSGQYPQPQYQDAPFNPYEVQQQQARGYDQGGLGGGYGYSDQDPSGRTKERTGSTFEDEDIVPPPIGDKCVYTSRNILLIVTLTPFALICRTPGNIRRWRKDYQGKMWTKGSRASCFGRFFCCTIMVFLFFLISIVLSLALVSLTCGNGLHGKLILQRSGSAHQTSSLASRRPI